MRLAACTAVKQSCWMLNSAALLSTATGATGGLPSMTVKELADCSEPYCFVRRPPELDKRGHELRGIRAKAFAHIFDHGRDR
jgi:hypothetical protein